MMTLMMWSHIPDISNRASPPKAAVSPFGFLILSPERDRLVRALEARRIQTRPLFGGFQHAHGNVDRRRFDRGRDSRAHFGPARACVAAFHFADALATIDNPFGELGGRGESVETGRGPDELD